MKQVKLVKLSDDKFNGQHPNGIIEGSLRKGYIQKEPIEGNNMFIYQKILNGFIASFYTSVVTEIVKKTKSSVVFKTLNSTYKLTYVKEK